MSTKPGPAADIEPRSLWRRRDDGALVRVRDRADGYVRPDSGEFVWHSGFRAMHVPLYDRPDARSQFSMCCANLAEFRMLWNPATGKLIARSVICKREFRIPAGVVPIGVYCAPFDPEYFLSDLDSCITLYERYTAALQANI